MDIIAAYREVGTYRGAAQMCGVTHKTVRRVVERFEAGEPAAPPAPRPHNFDAVVELVAKRVGTSNAAIEAKRLLPVARAAGYEGSARNFRRLVAEQKRLWRNSNHRGRRPAVWSPGEYLVIDWTPLEGGWHLFCAVLAWCRWRYVAFATDERATTTLALIAEAMAAAGGVPRRVLADRMACLKGGVVANVVIPTPDYVRFASHYGFSPDFCHANDPEHKGIIERAHDYLERSFLPGRTFTGPGDFNAQLQDWLALANGRRKRSLGCAPTERIAADKASMLTLPPVAPATGWRASTRLPRDYYVRIDSNDYSVNPGVIGRRIELAVDLDRVKAFCDGRVVADHQRVWAWHQTISDPEHVAAAKTLQRHRVGLLRPLDAGGVEVEQRSLADYDTALGVDLDEDAEGGVA